MEPMALTGTRMDRGDWPLPRIRLDDIPGEGVMGMMRWVPSTLQSSTHVVFTYFMFICQCSDDSTIQVMREKSTFSVYMTSGFVAEKSCRLDACTQRNISGTEVYNQGGRDSNEGGVVD